LRRALRLALGPLLLAGLLAAEEPKLAGAPGGPRLVVEPTAFDFGRTQPRKTLQKEFRLRNLGTEDLVIEGVTTTCGCTVADGYGKVVKPGASTGLRVSLTTGAATGRLSRSVLVRTNDPVRPRVELKVEATVVAGGR